MSDTDIVTETVTMRCPYCGMDAEFTHEPGVMIGMIYCRLCEEAE